MSQIYFAYGSNMKIERITKRAPSVRVLGRARILDKQLAFNKISTDGSGKANIVDASSIFVWGVLYEIDECDIPKLDDTEKGYDKQNIVVMGDNERPFRAFTYIATRTKEGLIPYDWYLKLIIQGAEDNKLPKEY